MVTRASLIVVFMLCVSSPMFGQMKLPKLISDGMVLQRDVSVNIWGWDEPGQTVNVTFADFDYQSIANDSGKWEIQLRPMPGGGPHEMKIKGSSEVTLTDILIGEVWVASGQSNMELPLRRTRYHDILANTNEPKIRQFFVGQTYDFDAPRQDVASGKWVSAVGNNIHEFSAVAWFFAKELSERYDVAVGIINSSLGGSPAEAWMSEEALRSYEHHLLEAYKFRSKELRDSIEALDSKNWITWYDDVRSRDMAYKAKPYWTDPSADVSFWQTVQLPGYPDLNLGADEPRNGVFWFRKDFDLPSGSDGKPARLELGAIIDADSVFINGQFVANTTYMYPPRWYTVPEGILKSGRNSIVIRVFNERGHVGFVPDKPYELEVDDHLVNLEGDWKFQIGALARPHPGQTFIRWKPMGLYNAMLAPLFNYSVRGVIWYQGESNVGRASEYYQLFPDMISDWRKGWNDPHLPFIFVQLSNFLEARNQPVESAWAMLRDAQLKTLSLPHTGMAVTIDIGEWNDIHPVNKKDVGKRLALQARKLVFNEKITAGGPMYNSHKVERNRIRIRFENVGGGLVAKGGVLREFAIAGDDGRFIWANAMIDGSDVIVWSDEIEHPLHVRYAWADNPQLANLYNVEGLPASPFRSDDF